MRQWIGGTAPVWPQRSWQVYALPQVHLDERGTLAELVHAYRAAVELFGQHLAPVADRDVHMTVQPLPGWIGDYDDSDVNDVLHAVRTAVGDLEPITVQAGPALAGSAGVILDVDAVEDGPLHTLFRRVTDAVADATGHPPAGSGWPGHLSLGYCRADGLDSGDVQSKLRRVRSRTRATWTISELYLCDVAQDPTEHTYTWTRNIPVEIGKRGP